LHDFPPVPGFSVRCRPRLISPPFSVPLRTFAQDIRIGERFVIGSGGGVHLRIRHVRHRINCPRD